MHKKSHGYADRLKHLKNVLHFLTTNSSVDHVSDARRLLCAFSDSLDKLPPSKWKKQFPKLEIPIESSDLTHHNPVLIIGGVIEGNGCEITFSSLSFCISFATDSSYQVKSSDSCCLKSQGNQRRIVRRFHFDYQPQSKGHPVSHLQYGGKFPTVPEYSAYHYCIEDFIENPRFHYPPIDIVLLLDMLLNEFPTSLSRLSSEREWRGYVLKSQNLWWKGYVDDLKACVSNPQGKTFHEIICSD